MNASPTSSDIDFMRSGCSDCECTDCIDCDGTGCIDCDGTGGKRGRQAAVGSACSGSTLEYDSDNEAADIAATSTDDSLDSGSSSEDEQEQDPTATDTDLHAGSAGGLADCEVDEHRTRLRRLQVAAREAQEKADRATAWVTELRRQHRAGDFAAPLAEQQECAETGGPGQSADAPSQQEEAGCWTFHGPSQTVGTGRHADWYDWRQLADLKQEHSDISRRLCRLGIETTTLEEAKQAVERKLDACKRSLKGARRQRRKRKRQRALKHGPSVRQRRLFSQQDRTKTCRQLS